MTNAINLSEISRISQVGDEILCMIERYARDQHDEYVILSDIRRNNAYVSSSVKMYLSWTNADLLSRIYPHDAEGYPQLAGQPARLLYLSYETDGYNASRYVHTSYLFQPFDSIIKAGKGWRLL